MRPRIEDSYTAPNLASHRGCWPICALIWALCSWNRSLSRLDMAMDFCTQRVMQPVSRDERDLEVKSSMQDTKQWSTRLPKSYEAER